MGGPTTISGRAVTKMTRKARNVTTLENDGGGEHKKKKKKKSRVRSRAKRKAAKARRLAKGEEGPRAQRRFALIINVKAEGKSFAPAREIRAAGNQTRHKLVSTVEELYKIDLTQTQLELDFRDLDYTTVADPGIGHDCRTIKARDNRAYYLWYTANVPNPDRSSEFNMELRFRLHEYVERRDFEKGYPEYKQDGFQDSEHEHSSDEEDRVKADDDYDS